MLSKNNFIYLILFSFIELLNVIIRFPCFFLVYDKEVLYCINISAKMLDCTNISAKVLYCINISAEILHCINISAEVLHCINIIVR